MAAPASTAPQLDAPPPAAAEGEVVGALEAWSVNPHALGPQTGSPLCPSREVVRKSRESRTGKLGGGMSCG